MYTAEYKSTIEKRKAVLIALGFEVKYKDIIQKNTGEGFAFVSDEPFSHIKVYEEAEMDYDYVRTIDIHHFITQNLK